MVLGKGSTTATLTTEDVQQLLARAVDELLVGAGLDPSHRRVLVIIPDGTRTAPIPLMFRLLYEQFGRRVAQLDYLIALGTHPPMLQEAIDHLVGVTVVPRLNDEPGYIVKTPSVDHLVGMTAAERAQRYPNVRIFNHEWHNPQVLQTIGVISHTEAEKLTGGLLTDDVPVRLNRLIFDYDLVLICGPVFPHEVAGFCGGAKYLFPGIAGPDIINFTHWLGALATSLRTMGIKDTPVRRVITQTAGFVTRPLLCLAMVMQGQELHDREYVAGNDGNRNAMATQQDPTASIPEETLFGGFRTQEMLLNRGPQHPSTHGVMRLALKLEGETVVECTPVIGYLHRGIEKILENRPYLGPVDVYVPGCPPSPSRGPDRRHPQAAREDRKGRIETTRRIGNTHRNCL